MKISLWKRIVCTSLLAAVVLTGIPACASPQTQEKAGTEAAAPAAEKKIRTGFYVEDGSRSCGVLFWARLLAYSPQLEVTLIDAADVRAGKLKGLDLLVVPGGSSHQQCVSLNPDGMEIVRQFVADGGAFVGACAGFHCTLNRPERLRLLPFEYMKGAGGNFAPLAVDISEKGAKLMGIKAGRYMARYSHGPIARPGKQPGEGWGEVLGVYKSTVSPVGKPGGNFFNAPAVIHGQFGKGKVIATSFHPESYESTHCIALGEIYAVTGVRPKPVYPEKKRGRIRVGYYAPAIVGKYPVEAMLALDRCPDIDVQFVDGQALNEGILPHLDVFVLPHGRESAYKSHFTGKLRTRQLREFVERGGVILASGNAGKGLFKHENIKRLPADACFVKSVREVR
ncbi:MAG: hypothetical protein IJS14_09535 [Lentisphaeria bacterium]|nr:hypothetical protein [Lentisphaeria bacterium]